MKERRKRIMKRLLVEELERREMLSGPPQIANIPGIGSFAWPTAGPSKAGGTGHPNSPLIRDLAAVDVALEELYGEPDEEPVAKTDSDAAPADVPEQTTSAPTMIGLKQTARRAWNTTPDELDAEEASPAGAAADR